MDIEKIKTDYISNSSTARNTWTTYAQDNLNYPKNKIYYDFYTSDNTASTYNPNAWHYYEPTTTATATTTWDIESLTPKDTDVDYNKFHEKVFQEYINSKEKIKVEENAQTKNKQSVERRRRGRFERLDFE